MFLSKDDLKLSYGVDLEIGKFLVDRRVPPANAYWKKKHLYMNPQPGYVFIPIYTDLAFRIGIPKNALLAEEYLLLMEQIMDSAARQEIENIPMQDHISECIELSRRSCKNERFLKNLNGFFNGEPVNSGIMYGTPFPSLNRAHAYLFSLTALDFDEATEKKLVDAWNALMIFFLVKDDLVDIKDDLKNSDSNVVLEAGLNERTADVIAQLLNQSYNTLHQFNQVMSNRVEHMIATSDIRKMINAVIDEKAKSK
jgi:hypothetical protein